MHFTQDYFFYYIKFYRDYSRSLVNRPLHRFSAKIKLPANGYPTTNYILFEFVSHYELLRNLTCSTHDFFLYYRTPYSSDSLFVNKITAFESDFFCVFAYHSCCSLLLVNFIFCIFFIRIIFYYYYVNPISSNYRKCHYRKCQ